MMRRIFSQFVRSYTTLDLRPAESTRKARCERYARKYKTCGKRAVFAATEPLGWTLVQA